MGKYIITDHPYLVNKAEPLDNKSKVQTIEERDKLVTDGLAYESLKTYVLDEKKWYEYDGSQWNEITSGSSGDLTDYQKKTDNTLTTTDKAITGAINEVNGNSLDTVGFSADHKNIILNRKNGLNPYTIPISAIINNAKLIELNDVDSTDIGNGKTLVYDATTNKHKYVDSTGTDELVKMEASTDAHYLSDLIDKSTVVNDNGVLKVKKLDGQEVTIAEINYLKGLTMNVMDLVNAFTNGGVKVLDTPLNTASELDTIDRTSFIDGISYIVYVLIDETHSNAKTTYLCTKTSTIFFGNADSQRNFTTNPIDLANEVTGKLGTSNIDVDSLWSLLTIDDTYKTLTTTDNVFGTHGAKAMYDELTTDIGEKANTTDLTTHARDINIHVSTTQTDKWDKVTDKVDKTDITNVLANTSTINQIPNANLVAGEIHGKFINLEDYSDALRMPSGKWRVDSDYKASLMQNLPVPEAGILEVKYLHGNDGANPFTATFKYSMLTYTTINGGIYKRSFNSNITAGKIVNDTGWEKIAVNDARVTRLETQVSELFQSVSNGKKAVANAITGKGVSTSSTATFATMATNIGKISVSSYKEETKSYTITSSGITPLTITFSANVLGVKQVIPPTYSSRITTQTSSDIFTINGKVLTLLVTGAGTWKVTALIEA